MLSCDKRRFKIVSVRKPRYALKSPCKSIIQRFQLKRSGIVRVDKPLVQQYRLLLLAVLISFGTYLWLKEFIGVQVDVGLRVKRALRFLILVVYKMLHLVLVAGFLFFQSEILSSSP